MWDLEPAVFQRVLLARLDRMEIGQATRLDRVLFGLHTDLADGFADLQDRMERVLDRLPPGAAGREQVEVYLAALISWLDTDPWPRHQQFGGPVLTPAAIERKLRASVDGVAHGPDVDADELAERCQRLVILGAPGSGKTWLARRTARRCAEQALRVIRAGGTLEDVELPLFTTCAALLGAAGDIRKAVVSSALNQLGDLGGSRISAALEVLFAERNAAVLLVLDSLDEAEGSSKRIRQTDTLPWRIVLTSRPSSWNGQLVINVGTDAHRVGVLQPLSYPDDVEPFIRQWFSQQPERSGDLVAQIARRPDLQKAATVPLILAFYCIIGSGQPLPQFRRDLYAMVLRRMLTGRWRGDEVSRPELDLCLGKLRDWAWSGATADPVSGVGRWADTFLVADQPLGGSDDSAVDHIAMPLGPPDLDIGRIERRFVHRTVREHLVAEYVARLPLEEAAAALLPHLWYDPDWEYAAPAALVMHGQRDELLQCLICQAAGSDRVPEDLSVIDGGWEFRGFLARVAAESCQADWSPEIACTIGQARVELAMAERIANLGGGLSWQTSNCQVREALLGLLAAHNTPPGRTRALAEAAVGLAETAQERAQLREALLGLLAARDIDPWRARALAEMVTGLDPTPPERAQLREALLGLLAAHDIDPWRARALAEMVTGLDPTPPERAQLREVLLGVLAGRDDTEMAYELAEVAARLAETAQERTQLGEALIRLAVQYNHPGTARELVEVAAGLAYTPQERAQLREVLLGVLAGRDDTEMAYELAEVAARLAETAQERTQLREVLIRLVHDDSEIAVTMAKSATRLADTAQEQAQLRQALLESLPAHDNAPWRTRALAEVVAGLDPTAQERAQLREALLGLLAAHDNAPWWAYALAEVVTGLDPTAQERAQLRERLLGLLAECGDPDMIDDNDDPEIIDDYREPEMVGELARSAAGLAETVLERTQVWETLLQLVTRYCDSWSTGELVKVAAVAAAVAETAEERAQLRGALLRSLTARHTYYSWQACQLVQTVKALDPTAQERAQLLGMLLQLTDRYNNRWETRQLIEVAQDAAGIAETAQERAQVRQALLRLLAAQDHPGTVSQLVEMVNALDPTAEDRAQVRQALLRLLAAQDHPGTVSQLVEMVNALDPTAEDRAQVRQALLRLLAAQDHPGTVSQLVEMVNALDPTAEDRAQVRQALLRLLANPRMPLLLAEEAAGLAETAQERAQVRDALLALLTAQSNPRMAEALAGLAIGLAETAQERAQVRDALLALLTAQSNPRMAEALAGLATGLAETAQERAQVRDALLALLAAQSNPTTNDALTATMTRLRPIAWDLANWLTPSFSPTGQLLSAVRQNSVLADWLAVLPSLCSLPPMQRFDGSRGEPSS